MKCGSGSALDDLLDDLLEMSIIDFSGTPLEFLGDINIMGLLKDAFDEIVGGSLGNIIIPQKICPGDPKSLSQIGEEKHIDACARMVDVSKTKAIAFGFQAGSVSGVSAVVFFSAVQNSHDRYSCCGHREACASPLRGRH
jgi:hypothetical protein